LIEELEVSMKRLGDGLAFSDAGLLATVFSTLMLAAVTSTPAAAEEEQGNARVALRDQGYFFVGGQYYTASDGQFIKDQMYVEYQIPANLRHRYPIVLIHGGGLTATYMMGTPDGREGWNTFFLRQGYAVYVPDQTGRGKSAYHADVYGPTSRGNALGIEQRFTAFELFNQWPNAHLHTQWPGSGLIGDPIFDQFYASEVEGMASATIQQSTMQAAGAALLDKIGPAIILTHSQSGPYGWLIADARPSLVKALVQVEPSGPPLHSVTFLGLPDWFTDGPVQFPWGITAVPLNYSPAVTDPTQLLLVQQPVADNPDVVKCWRQATPARSLPNLKGIPILMVTSEAGYHSSYDNCTSEYLTQAGVQNTHVYLGDVGIHGNGHMMMLEKNNLDISAFMADWLSEHAGDH
jgi:pimeloyl-ACP methyl ester carboxylesterase